MNETNYCITYTKNAVTGLSKKDLELVESVLKDLNVEYQTYVLVSSSEKEDK